MYEITPALEAAGFAVARTSYDNYGVPRFLAPFPQLKRKAIERVERNIRTAIFRYRSDTGVDPEKLSVISHSFGTYVVSQILQNQEFAWYRVIFCGSVVRNDFDFDAIFRQFRAPLLNDVGTKDFWPALAASAGWGYGAVGSYGLNHPLVDTRWHHGFKHSDFLTAAFCNEFWINFLKGSPPIQGDRPVSMPLWIRTIARLPLNLIILVSSVIIIVSVIVALAKGGILLFDLIANRTNQGAAACANLSAPTASLEDILRCNR